MQTAFPVAVLYMYVFNILRSGSTKQHFFIRRIGRITILYVNVYDKRRKILFLCFRDYYQKYYNSYYHIVLSFERLLYWSRNTSDFFFIAGKILVLHCQHLVVPPNKLLKFLWKLPVVTVTDRFEENLEPIPNAVYQPIRQIYVNYFCRNCFATILIFL